MRGQKTRRVQSVLCVKIGPNEFAATGDAEIVTAAFAAFADLILGRTYPKNETRQPATTEGGIPEAGKPDEAHDSARDNAPDVSAHVPPSAVPESGESRTVPNAD